MLPRSPSGRRACAVVQPENHHCHVAEEKTKLHKKTLAVLEETDRTQPKENATLTNSSRSAALGAGEAAKAEAYAKELLEKAAQPRADGMNDLAIHHGNLVLGHIALKRADVGVVKAHLLAAGKTGGGGTLSPFGPNMALAKDLLEKGGKADGPRVSRTLQEVLAVRNQIARYVDWNHP